MIPASVWIAMSAWIESSGLISADQPPFGLSPSSGTATTRRILIVSGVRGRSDFLVMPPPPRRGLSPLCLCSAPSPPPRVGPLPLPPRGGEGCSGRGLLFTERHHQHVAIGLVRRVERLDRR